jgi:hypothetical protein
VCSISSGMVLAKILLAGVSKAHWNLLWRSRPRELVIGMITSARSSLPDSMIASAFLSLCYTIQSLGSDNFVSFTTRACKRRLVDCNDDSSIADTILPLGWIMHRPMFHLSKWGGQWSTFLGKSTFANQVVYPSFVSKLEGDVFKSGEAKWVQASVNRADELGFSRVDVFCGAIIPTKRVGNQNMSRSSTNLFCCHRSFHSYPFLQPSWHDWAMIKWQPHDGGDSDYTVAAHLLLFAKLSQHSVDKPPHQG